MTPCPSEAIAEKWSGTGREVPMIGKWDHFWSRIIKFSLIFYHIDIKVDESKIIENNINLDQDIK